MTDALRTPPEMSASDIDFNRREILTGYLRGTVFQEPFERLCRQALAAIALHEQAKGEPVPATHWGWDYLDNGQLIATYLVPVANPHRRPLGELVAPKLYAAPSTDLLRRVAEAVQQAALNALVSNGCYVDHAMFAVRDIRNADLDAIIASATAP